MANVFEYIADLMSYWSEPRLPPELRKLRHGLVGDSMERYASLGLDSGIFEVIGGTIPPRCVNPDAALKRAMREVSAAFFVFEEYRQRGIEIGTNVSEPLVRSFHKFFKTLGEPRDSGEVRAMIETFLAAHSVADPITADEFFGVPVLNCPLLERLRAIDREGRRRIRRDPKTPWMDDIGLTMEGEFDDSRYNEATPLNARTFASTGGDGVHFSLMVVDGALSDESPVVVTDPTGGGEAHAIAGGNLWEFLCLGYYMGYFCFQSLADESQRDELLPQLLGGPTVRVNFENDFGHAQPMMQRLRREFDLKPWTDAGRFDALQQEYKPLLKVPPT